jgi:isopentenyl diphosphate isomerase/L-lactate dehydrogenase-like FMN-dependent dehydrogenase
MRALRTACCVEDLRNLARSRIPKPFYDYVDAGSWSESTYRSNELDFAALKLRQKVLVDIEKRSVRSAMLGHSVAMPLALAPCGFGGMMWQDGEIAAAQVVVLHQNSFSPTPPPHPGDTMFMGRRPRSSGCPLLCRQCPSIQ